MKQLQYNTALYMRLSRDDESFGDSVSIETQRTVLTQFVGEHPEFHVVSEFVEDGWSGTNFERPQFKRMMEEIEAGKINCVISKDLSRFGREHIMMGYYLEFVFPKLKVRYIAVNDNEDTDKGLPDFVPFKNLINEFMAKDTSRKIKGAFRAKFLNGERVNSMAPFGYIKHPEIKNKLMIDEETAWIVRKIFDLAFHGMGIKRIAGVLMDERIPCPGWFQYTRNGGCARFFEGQPDEKRYMWFMAYLKNILKDETYIGNTIHNRWVTVSYKNKRIVRNPDEKCLRIEGTHEAIIETDVFGAVQKQIASRRRENKNKTMQIFSGLLKCADCGWAMRYCARTGKGESIMKYWNATAYLRTSKGIQEDPDNTIQTQLGIIMEFISTHTDIELCSAKIDNGYTGLTSNRPAFQEMMDEIDLGTTNCVIVKDLSRFSRNHLDAGNMIFCKFAAMKVRFIAVLDDVDMLYLNENQQDFFIPFKTLVNQMCSLDISKKTVSQLRVKRERGEFVGGQEIYGYKRSPTDRHQLVVDEPAAAVVRDIFQWRLEGLSADRIAQRLNQMGVPSPAEYKRKSNSAYVCHFQQREEPIWFARSVIRILCNRVYIGILEQGKSRSNPLYPELTKRLPESEWVVKENAHEAIISSAVFEAVGRLLKTDARIPPNQETPYLFSGIARCAACKNTLSRKAVGKYKYYSCSLVKYIKESCIGCQIPVEKFDGRVQQMIGEHIEEVMSLLKRIAAGNIEDKLQRQIIRLRDEIRAVESKIDRQQFFIRKLAPTLEEGLITKEEAHQLHAKFEAEQDALEKKRSGILEQIRHIEDGTLLECSWAKHFMPYVGKYLFHEKT